MLADDFKPTLKSAIKYLKELIAEDEERARNPRVHIMYGTQGRALLSLAADALDDKEPASDNPYPWIKGSP